MEKIYLINCKIPTAFGNAASYLDDLLAREHTPSDGIRTLAMGVGPQISLSVDGIVGDPRILFNPFDEFVQQGGRYKELEVCLQGGTIWQSQPRLVSCRPRLPTHSLAHLLIDIPPSRSPSMRGVLASGAIDGRLTVDRQISQLVHLGQLLVDDRSLLGRRLTRPRQRFEVVPTKLGEEGGNVREPGRNRSRSTVSGCLTI